MSELSPLSGAADYMCSERVFRLLTLTDLGSSPCHTVVNLAAKSNKIDGLGQKRLGCVFQGFSPGIRVAVGGDHNNGDVARSGHRRESGASVSGPLTAI